MESSQNSNQNCPFCSIVTGKIPTRKIYEDEHLLVTLDINPAGPGHMLLLPKKHYASLQEVPLSLMMYLAAVCKQMSWAALRGLQMEGSLFVLSQGEAAGQTVPHLFFHLIPRKENDGLSPITLPHQPFSPQDINDMRVMVIRGLKQVVEGGDV